MFPRRKCYIFGSNIFSIRLVQSQIWVFILTYSIVNYASIVDWFSIGLWFIVFIWKTYQIWIFILGIFPLMVHENSGGAPWARKTWISNFWLTPSKQVWNVNKFLKIDFVLFHKNWVFITEFGLNFLFEGSQKFSQ